MITIALDDTLALNYELDDFTDPWLERPFIVLQHGNGRSARFWYRWLPYLCRHFRILRPDMRGLGKSAVSNPATLDLTLEILIEDLMRVLDHAGAKRVHFCGESMGGILGLAAAANHPDRIATLTLVSTPVFIENEMKQRYALGQGSRIEAMQKLGIREWVTTTTRTTRLPADQEPELFSWYVEEFAKGDPDVQVAMSRLVNEANAADLLAKVRQPVLGLYPTGGQITSDRQLGLLRDGLENFELQQLPTPYHMVQLLFPEACTQRLADFCHRHEQAIAR